MKQASLFTSSFEDTERKGKEKKAGILRTVLGRIAGALLILCLFSGIEKCMEFALINDTNEWSRALFHDFYTKEENIDFLYLGSSHVYCGLNPAILKEKTGKNCFNMATPAQPLNGSYYLLKEAVKHNHISHVYLELYFGQSVGKEGEFKEADQLPRNWRNTNYMKPSFNKFAYMLTMSRPELYYMTFLPSRRYAADLFDLEKIKETIRQKRTADYKNYYVENRLNGVIETYAEDGFYYSEHRAGGGVFYDIIKPEPFSEKPMSEEAECYLRKIIRYCEKENIALTLYSAPVTDYQASLYGDYDRYVSQVKEIAAEYELSYYDFNLCKEGVLDLTDDGLFRDQGHLNVYGAERFSSFFADFFTGLEEGNLTYEDCFYSSYREKVQHSRERIFGLLVEKGEITENGEVWYRVTPIHNLKDGGAEILVYTTEEDGEKRIWEDWTVFREESFSFRVQEGCGTLFIEVKPAGEEETTNAVQIEA